MPAPGTARVAVVTNVLSHYRAPCFEALARRLPGQIDFFLLSGEMAHRSYVLARERPRIPVQVLPGRAWSRPPFDDLHLNDPRPALKGHTLVILSGWAEPSYMLLWALARLERKKIGFWIESTLNDARRTTWKEIPKRAMLRPAVGVIATGSNAAAYCERLGAPRGRIFIAPNAVNAPYFCAQADALLPVRDALRRELGLEGVVILFVGRMVDVYKRVSVLLRAHQQLEQQGLPAQLVLIGEGPDRAGYEQLCREFGLRGVRFENFMDHAALSRYYAAADIFVLPSRSETWGLVINEAMEFRLPIVTTRAVGAAADLVRENENGFIVRPDDADSLAAALTRLARDDALRRSFGECSRRIIAGYTPETWADGFARAVEAMLQ